MKTFNEIFQFSNSKEGKFRLKVIEFFSEYGLKATRKAFGVPRATIYRWRKIYKDNQNNQLFLIPKSRVPKHQRTMQTDYRIIKFIAGYYEIDTIQRFVRSTRIYIFNAVDIKTRFQFSYAYRKGTSLAAKDFFQKLESS